MRQSRLLVALAIMAVGLGAAPRAWGDAIIIDHTRTDITALSLAAIENAKANLHIAYAHTSHGRQVTGGMEGLVSFANKGGLGLALPPNTLAWNHGGTGGALDLHDYFVEGDLGQPDRVTWAQRTRDYLDDPANRDVNVVMWSWCGQVSSSTAADIDTYLGLMSGLEADYPGVWFVYMTGHLDGSGLEGNLHQRNEQIRAYCRANGKILYDFADIESYAPGDPTNYLVLYADDACAYDPDGALPREATANWALEWQARHTEDVDFFKCSAPHSQWLNGNQKGYAAWALWTELGVLVPEPGTGVAVLVGAGLGMRRRRRAGESMVNARPRA